MLKKEYLLPARRVGKTEEFKHRLLEWVSDQIDLVDKHKIPYAVVKFDLSEHRIHIYVERTKIKRKEWWYVSVIDHTLDVPKGQMIKVKHETRKLQETKVEILKQLQEVLEHPAGRKANEKKILNE